MDMNKMKLLHRGDMDKLGKQYSRPIWWAIRYSVRGLLCELLRLGLWGGSDDVISKIENAIGIAGGRDACRDVNLVSWTIDDARWFRVGCIWWSWYNDEWEDRRVCGAGMADLENTDVQGVIRDGDYGDKD